MASQFKFPLNTPLDRFERARAKLSDSVIGHVLPRRPARSRCFSSNNPLATPLQLVRDSPRPGGALGTLTQSDALVTEAVLSSYEPALNAASPHKPASPVSVDTNAAVSELPVECLTSCRELNRITDKAKRNEMKKVIRRGQCRTNQARYRNKKRIYGDKLQHRVHQLKEELQGLRLKRLRLCFSEKTSRSPWAIVSEVFCLLETSFQSPWHMTSVDEMMEHAEAQQSLSLLQNSFAHDVSMGSVSGVDALLEQLRRFALYFSGPQIQLKRVKSAVPGVLMASARLSVTVSEFTLSCVFPHLQATARNQSAGADDEHRALREKLLGQRLSCSCEMTFLVDEESGRVVRLETSINLVESLFQMLKSASGVVDVLGQALMTPECVVGNLADGVK